MLDGQWPMAKPSFALRLVTCLLLVSCLRLLLRRGRGRAHH